MSGRGSSALPTRLLIVEDQGLVRAFFEQWAAGLPRYRVVGSARTGEEALQRLESALPDVVLVDYQLPGMDGLEFVRAARQVRPQLRALLVSSLSDRLSLTRVREAGVEGYLEKDATPEMLGAALAAVAEGRTSFSKLFLRTLALEQASSTAVGKVLSKREQQVLAGMVAGRTSREIGDTLALGVRTIEFHRSNMMAKLGAKNLSEVLAIARRDGLV